MNIVPVGSKEFIYRLRNILINEEEHDSRRLARFVFPTSSFKVYGSFNILRREPWILTNDAGSVVAC